MANKEPWEGQWQDYLALMGLAVVFSEADLKRAYRAKAKTTHPDSCPKDRSAKVRFQILNEANEVLRDPTRRDAYLKAWQARNKSGRANAHTAAPRQAKTAPKAPPCAHPGCQATSAGVCVSCGHPICVSHRHILFTPQCGLAPGGYCPECLPKCTCGGLFNPKAADYPKTKADRVRHAYGQNLLCSTCLGSICDDFSCSRPHAHTCKTCGAHLCEKHAVKGDGGWFCSTCVERCQRCGTPIQKPTPTSLRPAEERLRRETRGIGRWCPSCLTHAPLFACTRCGTKGIPFEKLHACKSCGGTWLCGECHPDVSKSCYRCQRTATLQKRARRLSTAAEWTFRSGIVAGCLLPLVLWLSKHGGQFLWEEFCKGGHSAIAVIILLVIFTWASVMLGIIPGFFLGWVLSAMPRALAQEAEYAAHNPR